MQIRKDAVTQVTFVLALRVGETRQMIDLLLRIDTFPDQQHQVTSWSAIDALRARNIRGRAVNDGDKLDVMHVQVRTRHAPESNAPLQSRGTPPIVIVHRIDASRRPGRVSGPRRATRQGPQHQPDTIGGSRKDDFDRRHETWGPSSGVWTNGRKRSLRTQTATPQSSGKSENLLAVAWTSGDDSSKVRLRALKRRGVSALTPTVPINVPVPAGAHYCGGSWPSEASTGRSRSMSPRWMRLKHRPTGSNKGG
jgi:hypothetical protein